MSWNSLSLSLSLQASRRATQKHREKNLNSLPILCLSMHNRSIFVRAATFGTLYWTPVRYTIQCFLTHFWRWCVNNILTIFDINHRVRLSQTYLFRKRRSPSPDTNLSILDPSNDWDFLFSRNRYLVTEKRGLPKCCVWNKNSQELKIPCPFGCFTFTFWYGFTIRNTCNDETAEDIS